MAKPPLKRLNAKHERFCIALLANATQVDAYMLAFGPNLKGPKGKPRSKGTIVQDANALANNPRIKARLAELMAPLVEKALLTRERWLQEVVRCALFDPRQLFDSHGNCIEIRDLPDEAACAIAAFDQFEEFEGRGESRKSTGYTRKFKLVDKLKALELAGKAYKFYEEESGVDKLPKNLTITFVNGMSPHAAPAPVDITPKSPKVTFVPAR